ncbi:importin subunit alpha-3-like [Carpediemonas membranifera]|uniref:Importin subunit alpha n=1 Tax=Carpediemonas membranifera TaxID=201153 RepID=A0A8J6E1V7_9EUKA|nr:importin subunit alpha-3-like [Carpediemonas membranifera]|eukprot:KAG9393938.1 importin subunit alpha-3-like [Carpediemonas membranifera]
MADRNVRKGFDAVGGRKNRENDINTLRKQKREETFVAVACISAEQDFSAVEDIDESIFANLPRPDTDDEFFECATRLQSDDHTAQLQAAFQVRLAASLSRAVIFDAILRAGILPIAVNLLDTAPSPRLRLESAWLLTNLCSSDDYSGQVVGAGAVPVLFRAMDSSDDAVATQAIWCLGNLVCDLKAGFAESIIANGFVPRAVSLLDANPSLKSSRTLTWAVGCIAQQLPPESRAARDQLHETLPALGRLIGRLDHTLGDPEVNNALSDVLRAVGFCCAGDDADIAAVCRSGMIPFVVTMVSAPRSVAAEAIRILGNVTSADDDSFVDLVISARGLPALAQVVSTGPDPIVREALWALSNVAAGTQSQLTAALAEGVLPVVTRLVEQGSHAIRREAVFFIRNFTMNASLSQLTTAASDHGLIRLLCDCLAPSPGRSSAWYVVVLESIRNILTACGSLDPSVNPFIDLLHMYKGVDRISLLASNPKASIRIEAERLLQEFGLDDRDEMVDVEEGRLSFV